MEPQLSLTLTAILSGIALVASVLSPVLSTIFTNRHQRKLYDRQFYLEHRAKVIEEYLAATGAVIRDSGDANLADYGKCSGEIYLYVPQELHCYLEQISVAIKEAKYENALSHYEALCKNLEPPRGEEKHSRRRNVKE